MGREELGSTEGAVGENMGETLRAGKERVY